MKRERILLLFIENLIWILTAIAFIIFGIPNYPYFFSITIIHAIFQEASMLGFLALGLALTMINGSTDVSLGRIANLSCIVAAWLAFRTQTPLVLIFVTPIAVGLAIGAFHGFLIGKLRLNAFLITLVGYLIWDSLGRYIMTGHYFIPAYLDPRLLILGRGRIGGGIFVSTVLFICILLFTWFLAKNARMGNAIYATGASSEIAERLGINVGNVRFWTHTIAGLLAGLCGLVYVGYSVEIKPGTVPPFTIFPALVAMAIAGISVTGGKGSLLNVFGGTILIAMTKVGATMMGAGFEFAYYLIPGVLFSIVISITNRLDMLKDWILSRIYAPKVLPLAKKAESKEIRKSTQERKQKA